MRARDGGQTEPARVCSVGHVCARALEAQSDTDSAEQVAGELCLSFIGSGLVGRLGCDAMRCDEPR